MSERRTYRSPVRDAQVEQTRASLLDATEALLLEVGIDALSIPKIAKRAGVSAPTAYKYFPTNEELMLAFIEHVRPRLGLDLEQLRSVGPAELSKLPKRNYRRYERMRALLSAAMSSPTWHRLRLLRRVDRAAMIAPLFRDQVSAPSERDLRAALGAIYLFISPQTWSWLRQTWGLSGADASKAAAWAVSVLARELWTNPPNLDPVDLEVTDR